MENKIKYRKLCLSIPLFVGLATNANAQENTTLQDDELTVLDTITVTARRRDEDIQQVPFSVTGVQPDSIDVGVGSNDEVGDLAREVANLTLTEIGGTYSNTFLIRGVGSLQPMASDDSAVAVYENGVPKSIVSAPITLFDAERVEVLRGPQGTLFGRNSQGGAIQVIHNTPEFVDSFKISGSLGNLGQENLSIVANKQLSENLAARLALRHGGHDGNIDNIATGNTNGEKSSDNIRASLLWLVGDNTAVDFSLWSNRKESDSPRYILLDSPNFPVVSINPDNNVTWRDIGFSGKITHDWDNMQFTSLTSFEDSQATQDMDFTDGLIFSAITPLPAAAFNTPYGDYSDMNHDEKRWQQEFHLGSKENSDYQWQVGVNFFYSQFDNDTTSQASFVRYAWLNGEQQSNIDTLSTSLFGEIDMPISDKLRVNAGARITHERKEAEYNFRGNGHPAVVEQFSYQAEMSDTLLSGRLGLSAEITPQTTVYGNVARGTAAGGYPLFSMTLANGKGVDSYPASRSWTYEIGSKWRSADDSMQLNTGIFYNTVKDGRIIVFNGSAGILEAVTENYHSYGAELEGRWQMTPEWSLNGNVAYTHARLFDVAEGDLSGAKNGNRLANVPAVSATVGLHYQQQRGLFGDLSWQYVGKRSADLQNNFDLDAYSLLNAKIGYGKDNWEIFAFARNLTDEQAQIAGQNWSDTVQSVRLGEPRLFGLGFAAQW